MGCSASKDATDTTKKGGNVGSHLKSATELTSFPTFPTGCKSLLSKHMDQGIWD